MKNTAIADWFCILENGQPELRPTNSRFWKSYNEQANRNIPMFYGLYKSGELEKIADYLKIKTDPKNPDIKYVNFVIDIQKISDEFVERMNKEYPGNSLNEIDDMLPCEYTNCIALIDMPYGSYRDNCGCVGRSYELPMVMYLSNKECNELYNIALKSPVDAGIAMFKMY